MFDKLEKASPLGKNQPNSMFKKLNQNKNANLSRENENRNENSTPSHFQPQMCKSKFFPIFDATKPGVNSQNKANHSSSQHSHHHQHSPRGRLRPKKEYTISSQRIKTKPISDFFKSQNCITSSNTESAHQNQPNLKDPK